MSARRATVAGRAVECVRAAPRQVLIVLVRAYRLLFSAWIGPVCRYHPSCSAYALEALQRHGALGGSAYAAWRVLRCNPWSHGGVDPVPADPPWRGLFTRLASAGGDDAHPSARAVHAGRADTDPQPPAGARRTAPTDAAIESLQPFPARPSAVRRTPREGDAPSP